MANINLHVNDHYYDLLDNDSRYLILWGGAGSGKSVFIAQKIIIRCLNESDANHTFLCIRKVSKTIKRSIFALFKQIISDLGISHLVTENKTDHSFRFVNGNEIISAGVDDVEKLKSIAGITSIWIEEATELEEAEFDQIDLRLRGETASYKQICISFNPVSETHWLKAKFFDQESEKVTIRHSNYLHNQFLDDQYIEVLEERFGHDETMKMVYVDGVWGRVRTGKEYYTGFKRNKHVQNVPYLSYLPIVGMTWDFNVDPYITCLLVQFRTIKRHEGTPEEKTVIEIRVFKELCLDGNFNSIEGVSSKFDEWTETLQNSVYINVYGDASGKNRKTGLGNISDYDLIEQYFTKYLHEDYFRVLRRNPNLMKRRDFMNRLLKGKHGIELLIDESCIKTIKDFEEVQTGPNGKFKKMVTDKTTGTRYEEVGHPSDALDYLCCFEFWEAIMGDTKMW